MNIAENLINKIAPLTSKQSFITVLFILTLIVAMGFWYTTANQADLSDTMLSQVEKSDSINTKLIHTLDELSYNIKFNNRNNLTKNESLVVIDKTLSASKCQILHLIMTTLEYNHVNDKVRQKVIKFQYEVEIINLYKSDVVTLSNFKYKDKTLSLFLNKISPKMLTDDILEIMFNDDTKYQKRKDLMHFIDTKFDTFYQMANEFYK